MNCEHCEACMVKFGFDRKGQQRYRCLSCGITKTDSKVRHFDEAMKEQVDRMLKENLSLRAIGRILDFDYRTIYNYVRKKSADSIVSTRSISKNY